MVVARGIPYSAPNPLLACVVRAQAGDASAFTQLVRDHQHAIYSLVLGIVRNTEDAGDIVQDVWVKVARHLPQLREPERFVPWLYRIARNCSMDFCNCRKKRPQAAYQRDGDEDDSFDVPDSSTYVPEQELLSLDERRKVWEALGALSESDRTVLFLRESRELPYAEIARILGITCNAAEVRVFRARERFRKQFIEVEEAAPECNISPLQLGAYVDGELGEATQKMLERHIHSCTECTSRLTAIESGRVLYRGIGLFLMPSGLTASILTNLPILGFASAATAAAGTGVAVAATRGAAATGAAASGAAATTGAAATGAVAAATVTAAAGAGSSTFGAGIAAAVAAAAMTGSVAVEYAETSVPTPAPAAAVVEIAAPPAPPVTIVYEAPAPPIPASQPVAVAPQIVPVAPAIPTPAADDSSNDAGSDAGAVAGNSRGQTDRDRGSDANSSNDRGHGTAGSVTAALTKDERTARSERDAKNEKADAKSEKNEKNEKSEKADAKADAKSEKNDSRNDKSDSKSDAGRGNDSGGRGNDGGRDGGRDNDGGRGNDGGRDGGGRDNDDGGRGGHGR
jgi:RNA polymerase sigma factor (sigma-70 family)